MPGSRRSRRKLSAEALGVALLLAAATAQGQGRLVPYTVEGDGIPASLTGHPGDPTKGREIVANRQVGLCLLCHAAPIPEERFQGTIGPDLKGVGARLGAAQLRLRVVNPASTNENTVMPSYYRTTGLVRVGRQWRGKPILTAEQVEDVVAYLETLKE
jgi:sulfur-oxidizing protein SoxX